MCKERKKRKESEVWRSFSPFEGAKTGKKKRKTVKKPVRKKKKEL